MRELKFRAWDTITNQYILLGRYYVIDQIIKQYEYEQWTGCKDKTGRDIYEGDIVEVIGYGTYEVFWRDWDSSFSLRPNDASKDRWKTLILCNEWEYTYEIIGNIHENKELLEDKNDDRG